VQEPAPQEELCASVLIRQAGGDQPFQICAQSAPRRLRKEITVDAKKSVAGQVLQVLQENRDLAGSGSPISRAMIYVPSARYFHGVLLRFEKLGPHKAVFRTGRIVNSAYTVVPGTEAVNRCMVSTEIPLASGERSAVFNLSSSRPNSLTYLDFAAVSVATALVGKVLNGENTGKKS
jgi:hypothetical protein